MTKDLLFLEFLLLKSGHKKEVNGGIHILQGLDRIIMRELQVRDQNLDLDPKCNVLVQRDQGVMQA